MMGKWLPGLILLILGALLLAIIGYSARCPK